MGASFPILDFLKEAQVTFHSSCTSMTWPGHELTLNQAGKGPRANDTDLVMTEESDFPSSSAQAMPALDSFLPCLVPVPRMPWLSSAFSLCSSSSSEGGQVASSLLSLRSGFRLCLREEGPAGEWLL